MKIYIQVNGIDWDTLIMFDTDTMEMKQIEGSGQMAVRVGHLHVPFSKSDAKPMFLTDGKRNT